MLKAKINPLYPNKLNTDVVCFSDLVKMDLKDIIEIKFNTSMHCITGHWL